MLTTLGKISHYASRSTRFPSVRLTSLTGFRDFHVSSLLSAERRDQAQKPGKEEPRDVESGQPVAELAKEDEGKKGGVEDIESAPLSQIPSPKLFNLSNRTTIITGGGRGLGLTVAQSLLESGSSVACLDLLETPSEPQWSTAQSIAKSRGLTLTYTGGLDVTDPKSVKTAIENIFTSKQDTNEPVKSMFTAAGIQLMVSALEFPHDKFKKILDVNTTGTFLCVQSFAREWLGRNRDFDKDRNVAGGASIVMTASMSGRVANLGIEAAAYNASKAGVVSLARNLAMEWGEKGIRINTLSPGYIRTAMTANLLADRPDLEKIWLNGSLLGRLATPDEFRGPVIFLLSDASSFMQGSDLLIDGGHCAT